jgi:hypothetical protein
MLGVIGRYGAADAAAGFAAANNNTAATPRLLPQDKARDSHVIMELVSSRSPQSHTITEDGD